MKSGGSIWMKGNETLVVPKHPRGYLHDPELRRQKYTPLLQLGEKMEMIFLPDDYLDRDGFRPYRTGRRPNLPDWITGHRIEGHFNDFLVQGGTEHTPKWMKDQFWAGIMSIRGNHMVLTGLDPPEQHFTSWGLGTYSTFILPAHVAEDLLTPKFRQKTVSVWERLRRGVGVDI